MDIRAGFARSAGPEPLGRSLSKTTAMSTHDANPDPHPGNLNETRWLPPNDQDVVNAVTIYRDGGEIVVYNPTGTGWIQTRDWEPLSRCE